MLEHIEDWQTLLKRICNLSNRYVLLAFPAGRMREYEKIMGHLRNFQKGEIEKFMRGEGFKVVKTLYSGFPFYTPIARNWVNKNTNNYMTRIGNMNLINKMLNKVIYIGFRFFCFDNIGDKFTGFFERIDK